jgi:hypothetical protein
MIPEAALQGLALTAAAAPVASREAGGVLARHSSSKKSGGHRQIDDHANALLLAIGQCFRLDVPTKKRVRRLKGNHGRNGLSMTQLPGIEIGHTDPPDLSFLL